MFEHKRCAVFGIAAITVFLLCLTINFGNATSKRDSDLESLRLRKLMNSMTIFDDNKPATTLKVIILTYMRSGSSLTGDIIQEHPDVFYVFEPLMTVGKQLPGLFNQQIIHYYANNSSIKASWTGEGNSPLYLQTIKSVFDCRFDKLDNKTLQQSHMKFSKSTKGATICMTKRYSTETKWQQLLRCFQNVSSKCRAANIIAVKCILFSMQQAHVLISSDPTVKIIHLIRDPRGVVMSRQALETNSFSKTKTHTELEALRLCSKVLEDIEISKLISNKFGNRILTVRYEDIAESPIVAARQIYKFIGLEMTSFIENFIWNITYGGKEERNNFSTVRRNATETASRWRNKMDYYRIYLIQKSCAQVLNKVGYRFFNSAQEVKNFSITTKYKTYDADLMSVSI